MITHVTNQSWDWKPHPIFEHQLVDYNPIGHDPVYSFMSLWDSDIHIQRDLVQVSPQLHLIVGDREPWVPQKYTITGIQLNIRLDALITL